MRNYYEEIKEELIDNEVYKKAKDYSKNRHDLESYYNVGKLLVEAQGGEERAKYLNVLGAYPLPSSLVNFLEYSFISPLPYLALSSPPCASTSSLPTL